MREKAAIKIQSNFRRLSAQKQYKMMLLNKNVTHKICQKMY